MIAALHNTISSTKEYATHEWRVRAFKGLAVALGALFVGYMYLIGSITFNIVARNTLNKERNTLTSHVGELELQFLDLSTNISMDVAKTYGFSEAKNIQYITRSSTVSRLSVNSHDL